MSHLTPAQLQALTQMLDQRATAAQAEIRAQAGQRADEPYADLSGGVNDPGDDATADQIVDLDNAMIGMELSELRDIAAARERMKNGRYGVCIDCQQEIDFERLGAYPTAKRCARCQGLHERTFASAPHPTL
ncbi:MAG TPA: conjugal transfer protein TraR [Oxalobacteraceae bacterium]|nr:conjugal transfer protein TraR [Oxalobacteraceae bacterium]